MSTATSAEEAQGVKPLFWYRPCRDDGGYEGPVHNKSCLGKMLRDEKPGEWKPLFTRPAPPASNEALTVKLELMTAERDKLLLELGDLRALRARRPAHDNQTQIGGPDDWAIAGIEVKIGDGGPNFHLYRLLGSNELEPGVYELFARPAKPPARERAALIAQHRARAESAKLRGPNYSPCISADELLEFLDMLAADTLLEAKAWYRGRDAGIAEVARVNAQQVAVPQGPARAITAVVTLLQQKPSSWNQVPHAHAA